MKRTVELGPKEEKRVTFVTRDRPLVFLLDPDGWIVQLPEFDAAAKKSLHPQVFLKTVKEL